MRRVLTAAAAATIMTIGPLGVAAAQDAYPPGEQEPEVLPTSGEQEPTGGDTPDADDAARDDAEVRGLVLSRTGSDATALALLGSGAAVLGAGAVVLSRRRRE